MRHPIRGFTGAYRFLSNFYIEPDGSHVEGEYQAAKCISDIYAEQFRGLNPAQAKARGQRVTLRDDWERVKDDIMLRLVRQKFADHSTLMAQLIKTQGRYLEETNHWGDEYWGVCNGRGLNMLGHILMEVRG